MKSTDELTITARLLFDGVSSPLRGGTLTITDGRVAHVEERGVRSADFDFGNSAIVPGFVNAHTHLDLSGMRGQVPPTPDFPAWLRAVIGYRRSSGLGDVESSIASGLNDCVRFGTTTIGDIAAFGMSWSALAEARCWSVCFREGLGLPEQRGTAAWADIEPWLQARQTSQMPCWPGVSPHAPYSVGRYLFQKAAKSPFPVAIHLAESAAELQLLSENRGPFVEFLKDLNVWDPTQLVSGVEEVLNLYDRETPTLFVHGNYLRSDLRLGPNASVIYCPRTHAAFGHSAHPFLGLLAQGTRVAVGTDSLASNPDLDVFDEIRFLHGRCPEVPGATLLRMATLSGAEALGCSDLTGSLETGKSADLVVVPLDDREEVDPFRLLLESKASLGDPRRSMWRGQWRD